MTQVRIHGLLGEEFGEYFSILIENAKDVFDAIDANKTGFKKRIFDLHRQGFDYTIIVDGEKLTNANEILGIKNQKKIDIVPVIASDGIKLAIAVITAVVSVALTILLAPEPPAPPEISGTAESLEKSFTFSSLTNRAAQGTPIPIGYGELIVGSEVIQTSLKSYPQNQRALTAMARNPFDENGSSTKSASQFI